MSLEERLALREELADIQRRSVEKVRKEREEMYKRVEARVKLEKEQARRREELDRKEKQVFIWTSVFIFLGIPFLVWIFCVWLVGPIPMFMYFIIIGGLTFSFPILPILLTGSMFIIAGYFKVKRERIES